MPAHKPHSGHGVDSVYPSPADLPDEDCKVLQAGVKAFAQVEKGAHREHWLRIGNSLNTLQAAAMAAVPTDRPVGARYNECHAHYAQKYRAAAMLDHLDKPTKAHAMWLAHQWPVVENWLNTLSPEQRNKLNHPTTIRRHFDRATTTDADKAKLAQKDTVHKRLARTEDERDFYKTERNAFAAEITELHEIVQHIIPPNMPPTEAALRVRNEMDPDWVLEFRAALTDEPWHDEQLDDHPVPLS